MKRASTVVQSLVCALLLAVGGIGTAGAGVAGADAALPDRAVGACDGDKDKDGG